MVGFADGLQKGFGLVNDVYERRSKDQYRQEVIADRKAERLADEEYRERAFGLEKAQHKLKADQFDEDKLQNASQRETQSVINRRNLQQLDVADAELQKMQERAQTREALDNAALATNEIFEGAESAKTQEDYLRLAQLLKESEGTFLDAGTTLDPIKVVESQVMLQQIK
ncbi:MAG: hypothetical protein KJO69_10715, partial [Gammaproteobacteria bacterium]|nr:hypothetical protein [Gammaproteobacteria bacterium]